MTRKLIVTMAIGETSRKYLEFTGPCMKSYADKCDADFLVIKSVNPWYPHVGYQKYEYRHLLAIYDRILHIDADAVVRSDTPNLFELTDPRAFVGVDELIFQRETNEFPFIDRRADLIACKASIEPKFYINVGMFMFSHPHSTIFLPSSDIRHPHWHFGEQTEINADLHEGVKRGRYDVNLVSHNFNFTKLMELAGMNKDAAYIIHYAGGYGGHNPDAVLEMMKKDYR